VTVSLDKEEDGNTLSTVTCYRVHVKRPAALPAEVSRDAVKAAGRNGFAGITPDANGKLRELFKAYPESMIAGHEIRLDLIGISDGPKVMAVLHQMAALATALEDKS